ncbi:MAG: hypothetical protein ACRC0G_14110, partial [Fusobacteriaceae bacterium]
LDSLGITLNTNNDVQEFLNSPQSKGMEFVPNLLGAENVEPIKTLVKEEKYKEANAYIEKLVGVDGALPFIKEAINKELINKTGGQVDLNKLSYFNTTKGVEFREKEESTRDTISASNRAQRYNVNPEVVKGAMKNGELREINDNFKTFNALTKISTSNKELSLVANAAMIDISNAMLTRALDTKSPNDLEDFNKLNDRDKLKEIAKIINKNDSLGEEAKKDYENIMDLHFGNNRPTTFRGKVSVIDKAITPDIISGRIESVFKDGSTLAFKDKDGEKIVTKGMAMNEASPITFKNTKDGTVEMFMGDKKIYRKSSNGVKNYFDINPKNEEELKGTEMSQMTEAINSGSTNPLVFNRSPFYYNENIDNFISEGLKGIEKAKEVKERSNLPDYLDPNNTVVKEQSKEGTVKIENTIPTVIQEGKVIGEIPPEEINKIEEMVLSSYTPEEIDGRIKELNNLKVKKLESVLSKKQNLDPTMKKGNTENQEALIGMETTSEINNKNRASEINDLKRKNVEELLGVYRNNEKKNARKDEINSTKKTALQSVLDRNKIPTKSSEAIDVAKVINDGVAKAYAKSNVVEFGSLLEENPNLIKEDIKKLPKNAVPVYVETLVEMFKKDNIGKEQNIEEIKKTVENSDITLIKKLGTTENFGKTEAVKTYKGMPTEARKEFELNLLNATLSKDPKVKEEAERALETIKAKPSKIAEQYVDMFKKSIVKSQDKETQKLIDKEAENFKLRIKEIEKNSKASIEKSNSEKTAKQEIIANEKVENSIKTSLKNITDKKVKTELTKDSKVIDLLGKTIVREGSVNEEVLKEFDKISNETVARKLKDKAITLSDMENVGKKPIKIQEVEVIKHLKLEFAKILREEKLNSSKEKLAPKLKELKVKNDKIIENKKLAESSKEVKSDLSKLKGKEKKKPITKKTADDMKKELMDKLK